MQRLLIITQKEDPNDDLLGFFVDWIAEFRKQGLTVRVLALKHRAGESKLVRWIRLCCDIAREVRKHDAVFAHMSPMFAILAAIGGRPVYLWYLHRSNTLKLRIAEKLVKKIFTASDKSLTIASKKIVVVGHGINIDKYRINRTWSNAPLRIISVGRITPIKNYETLIATGFPVTIIGRPVMPGDDAYLAKLKTLGGDRVTFAGFISHDKMPEQYANADVVVNLSPTGGVDKAGLEAMASGSLLLVCNEAFNLPREFVFTTANSLDLKKKIEWLRDASVAQKANMSRTMVEQVTAEHNLPVTIKKIIAQMKS